MGTTLIILAGILGWILVGVLTALVVGKIVHRRDGHRLVEAQPDPRAVPAPDLHTRQSSHAAPRDDHKEQVSPRRDQR